MKLYVQVNLSNKLTGVIFFYTQAGLEVIPLEESSLWFAGKEMVRGKKLMDFAGKNEKTKIVCKLQKVRVNVSSSCFVFIMKHYHL